MQNNESTTMQSGNPVNQFERPLPFQSKQSSTSKDTYSNFTLPPFSINNSLPGGIQASFLDLEQRPAEDQETTTKGYIELSQ